jgi:hypothetical protein
MKGVNLTHTHTHVCKVNNVKIVDIFSNLINSFVNIFIILHMYVHVYAVVIKKI